MNHELIRLHITLSLESIYGFPLTLLFYYISIFNGFATEKKQCTDILEFRISIDY
jgi:hypothetical protein